MTTQPITNNPILISGYMAAATGDEMSHAWIAVTHLDEEGYEQLLAERREAEQRSLAGSDD